MTGPSRVRVLLLMHLRPPGHIRSCSSVFSSLQLVTAGMMRCIRMHRQTTTQTLTNSAKSPVIQLSRCRPLQLNKHCCCPLHTQQTFAFIFFLISPPLLRFFFANTARIVKLLGGHATLALRYTYINVTGTTNSGAEGAAGKLWAQLHPT